MIGAIYIHTIQKNKQKFVTTAAVNIIYNLCMKSFIYVQHASEIIHFIINSNNHYSELM